MVCSAPCPAYRVCPSDAPWTRWDEGPTTRPGGLGGVGGRGLEAQGEPWVRPASIWWPGVWRMAYGLRAEPSPRSWQCVCRDQGPSVPGQQLQLWLLRRCKIRTYGDYNEHSVIVHQGICVPV